MKCFINTSFFLFLMVALNGHTQGVNKSYLALGDSYTIGESVKEEFRWPNLLVDSLKNYGVYIDTPEIIAKTGWRADELLKEAKLKVIGDKKYDLVSVLIGVNNQYQGRLKSEFETQFKTVLSFAINHCKSGVKGVFVVSIPDYGQTPFGSFNAKQIGEEIDDWNNSCKNISEAMGIQFVNITDISRKGMVNKNLVAKDGLHPSGLQYAQWAQRIAPFVLKMIE